MWSTAGPSAIRDELCDEAVRLSAELCALLPDSRDAQALAALISRPVSSISMGIVARRVCGCGLQSIGLAPLPSSGAEDIMNDLPPRGASTKSRREGPVRGLGRSWAWRTIRRGRQASRAARGRGRRARGR